MSKGGINSYRFFDMHSHLRVDEEPRTPQVPSVKQVPEKVNNVAL